MPKGGMSAAAKFDVPVGKSPKESVTTPQNKAKEKEPSMYITKEYS